MRKVREVLLTFGIKRKLTRPVQRPSGQNDDFLLCGSSADGFHDEDKEIKRDKKQNK